MKKEEEEEWKDIEGYEGLYQVSNTGKIKSLDRVFPIKIKGRVLKTFNSAVTKNGGYPTVTLSVHGKKRKIMVHRAVAIAFLGESKNKPQVNHINGKKYDNKVENLEWVTPSENHIHAFEYGLRQSKEVAAVNIITLEIIKASSQSNLASILDTTTSSICRSSKIEGLCRDWIITVDPIDTIEKIKNGYKFGKHKPVKSIADDGIVKIYPSPTIAAKILNVRRNGITSCINNPKQKTAYGFKWKYV